MSEWISVEERLPGDAGKFLVFLPRSGEGATTRVYDWYAERECWLNEWYTKKRSQLKPRTWVTHWMPLPEPPSAASEG